MVGVAPERETVSPGRARNAGRGLRVVPDRPLRLHSQGRLPRVLVPRRLGQEGRAQEARQGQDARRRHRLLPRQGRQGRRPDRLVPPPRRTFLPRRLRLQGHHHLPLPRLRLRRGRPVRRRAHRERRVAPRPEDARPQVPHRGAPRRRLRLDGRDHPGAAGRRPPLGVQRRLLERHQVQPGEDLGHQLDGADLAGHRLPRVLPAPVHQVLEPHQLPAALLPSEAGRHQRRAHRR